MIIILSLILLVSVISLFILVYMAVYIVNMEERQMSFFSDLVNALKNMTDADRIGLSSSKTWDEKYEEEMEILRRRRNSSPDSILMEVHGGVPLDIENKHDIGDNQDIDLDD